jgi:hypothetical protein
MVLPTVTVPLVTMTPPAPTVPPTALFAMVQLMMLVVPDSQMPPALALSVLVVELPLIVELIRLSVEEQKIPPAELAAAVQVLPEMRQLLMFKVPDAP